jgi:hypothetical protein
MGRSQHQDTSDPSDVTPCAAGTTWTSLTLGTHASSARGVDVVQDAIGASPLPAGNRRQRRHPAAVATRLGIRAGVPSWATGLILGGAAAGNLLDRAIFGSVRDFLLTGPVVINLADVAVLLGLTVAYGSWATGTLHPLAARRRHTRSHGNAPLTNDSPTPPESPHRRDPQGQRRSVCSPAQIEARSRPGDELCAGWAGQFGCRYLVGTARGPPAWRCDVVSASCGDVYRPRG